MKYQRLERESPLPSAVCAINEMRAQLNHGRFLKRMGIVPSESYETCRRLYSIARDTAVKYRRDITNFPKTVR